MNRFYNKKIIITGGTSGIGEAVACEFAKENATVVLIGRNCTRGEEIIDNIKRISPNSFFIECDVANFKKFINVKNIIIEKLGSIDVLVNNAGVMLPSKDISILSDDDWNLTFDTNVKGIFYALKLFINELIKTKGCVINNASIAGLHSYVSGKSYAYSASKSAVIKLTRQMALNYASQGVRVNCICPGIINTRILGDRNKTEYAKKVPLGYIAEPIEVAKAVLFLASDDSKYITGAILPIDGGVSL